MSKVFGLTLLKPYLPKIFDWNFMTKAKTPKTKTEQLLTALRSGKVLSAKEIQKKFGFANPYRAIGYLREKRVCVYSDPITMRDGSTVTKYSIGVPSKQLAALGYTQ